MPNANAVWTKETVGDATQYQLSWGLNGAPSGSPVLVPVTPSGDSSGYTSDFNSANAGVTLKPGDQVSCTCVAIDTSVTPNVMGPPVSATVTIPTPIVPPGPAENFEVDAVP